jgi:steroid 5-alpha reductase family enzyme
MIVIAILYCALMVFILMTITYTVAQYKKDNSIVDCVWGLGFIVIAFTSLFFDTAITIHKFLVTTFAIIWGLRLSFHLFIRHRTQGEDPRYKKWRHEWNPRFFAIRSFFQIFMLQGMLMLIIAYPIIVINTSNPSELTIFDSAGAIIWIIGFIFEVIGDRQLKLFVTNPANKGKVLKTGLWHYTRHPNYFGEITMWWGIFLIALAMPYGITAIISPITITLLLVFVSGIPLAEKPFQDNPAYQQYKKETSILIPWWPKVR